ncbi:hypothetical protein KUTeg_001643 [Tegillarca granosa]|uniref:Uncharacterized protein n=1 Tax=Tegillarca granosa TaxID=220873 RepID=A0ABQ9FTI5_TEGGR|nr:hypothetical protein KUTeg_001643 [Tegillarca granosa]
MASEDMGPKVTSTPAKLGHKSEAGKPSPPPKYEDVAVNEEMFPVTKSRKNIAADFDSKEEIVLVIENESITCGVSDDDDDTDSDRSSAIFISFSKVHSSVSKFYEQNKAKIFMVNMSIIRHLIFNSFIYGALIAGYFSYFVAALTLCFKYGVRDPTPLIVITTVTIALIIIWYIKKKFGQHIYENCIKPPITTLKNTGNLLNIIYVYV